MHELSIVESVIDICENSAGGRKVRTVVMEIGELSGVVPEAVEFCFEACCSGTLLEGAQLNIERVPGRGRCPACGAAFGLTTCYDPCPVCGSFGVHVDGGTELRVKEMEVD